MIVVPGWIPPGPTYPPQPPIPQFNVSKSDAEAIVSFADSNNSGGASMTELNNAISLVDNFRRQYRLAPEVDKLLKTIRNVLEGTSIAFEQMDLNGDNQISYRDEAWSPWYNYNQGRDWWYGSRPSEVAQAAKVKAPANRFSTLDLQTNTPTPGPALPNFSIPVDGLNLLYDRLDDMRTGPQLSHDVVRKSEIEDFINMPRLAVSYPNSDTSPAAVAWRKDQKALSAARQLLPVFDAIAGPGGAIAEYTLQSTAQLNDPNTLTDEDFIDNMQPRG
ncbi:MAG: hypothetical protein KC475_01290 [Cyanobacteria bacterium HKST-UBA03]|nr:hypothetical protein [Cyanobacteria bacterium HKST-UBA03]